ncbi:MAG: HAMP domain-containing histidine kinase [Deltaproteobacteria bacterium]|nr:HAMP domain-containing histidine kinase [Deltaproteobacteria bacterium]
MPRPTICLQCAKRSCEASLPGTFEVCEYGVAFNNNGKTIDVCDTLVPLQMLSKNLRHELHRLLAIIVREAGRIDPSVSARQIDINHPASRIVGATVIIDHFVQMLTGVNDYHAIESGRQETFPFLLADVINNSFLMYSIIVNDRRAKDLKINCDFHPNIRIRMNADIFEYLVSILMDNAWKYSFSETTVYVGVHEKDFGLADVNFVNSSPPLPKDLDIFSKGAQSSSDSDGFGYGLFWAKVLIDHYNSLSLDDETNLILDHEEQAVDVGVCEQCFSLRNVPLYKTK